jgi:metal-sulfur cluster biosynthetic enzyme
MSDRAENRTDGDDAPEGAVADDGTPEGAVADDGTSEGVVADDGTPEGVVTAEGTPSRSEVPVETADVPTAGDGVPGSVEGDVAVEDGDLAVDGDSEASPCAYTNYREGESVDHLPATGAGAEGLEADVWDALYGVEDPEMPVSIVDLGLVYGIDVDDDGDVFVDMTLTYSGCPARDMLQGNIREALLAVDGVESVTLNLVWSPAWNVEMVTDAGRDDLREFGLSV